jgi:hypothetical protein
VRRVAVDRGEGSPVGPQVGVIPDAVAGGPELVGREQAHDRGQVTGAGPAQDDRGLTYVQRGQRIHPTSVPETGDRPGLRARGGRDQTRRMTSPRSSRILTASAALVISGSAAAGASGWTIRYSRWPNERS